MKSQISNTNTLALPRWVVGGGGGLAAGSSVSLNGTLGQPAVGSFTTGSVTLKAGYWTGASRSTIYLPIVIR